MKKQLIAVATIALTSALTSTAALAHVAGGALTDSAKNPVKGGIDKCVVVADGKFSSKCHDIKPKQVDAAPAAPAPLKPVTSVTSLSGDALFAFDSAELSEGGKAALDDFAFRSSALKVTNVKVVGHADSVGDEAYNQGLSERRAASVKAYLASKGMEESIIYPSGEGESSPIASNDTAEGRALNRRVDITVIGLRR